MRALLVVVLLAASATSALAQTKKPELPLPPKADPPVIDIDPLKLAGKIRGVMLLEFLERVAEELHAASLEKRSFVPELVRSLDEEAL